MAQLVKELDEGFYHKNITKNEEFGPMGGHPSRLSRDMEGSFGSEGYAFEELIAELASCFLNASLGIDYTQMRHAEYLSSWLNALKAKPKLLWKTASKAKEAFDYLMEFSKEEEKEQAT